MRVAGAQELMQLNVAVAGGRGGILALIVCTCTGGCSVCSV